jgi:hypothetical protein
VTRDAHSCSAGSGFARTMDVVVALPFLVFAKDDVESA